MLGWPEWRSGGPGVLREGVAAVPLGCYMWQCDWAFAIPEKTVQARGSVPNLSLNCKAKVRESSFSTISCHMCLGDPKADCVEHEVCS